MLTGVFLFASTTARSSNALLGWNCAYSFFSNVCLQCSQVLSSPDKLGPKIMYGVLYAISPELFPAKDRGTGNGLTATATRVFGVIVRLLLHRAFFHTLTGTPRLRSSRCTRISIPRCQSTSLERSYLAQERSRSCCRLSRAVKRRSEHAGKMKVFLKGNLCLISC